MVRQKCNENYKNKDELNALISLKRRLIAAADAVTLGGVAYEYRVPLVGVAVLAFAIPAIKKTNKANKSSNLFDAFHKAVSAAGILSYLLSLRRSL